MQNGVVAPPMLPPKPTPPLQATPSLPRVPVISDDHSIHVSVALPVRTPPTSARMARPGVARRTSGPPVPPPRPHNTISSETRDLILIPSVERLDPAPADLTSLDISLTSPRPGLERRENLYVDTPIKLVSSSCDLLKKPVVPSVIAPPLKPLPLSDSSSSLSDSILCRTCGRCKCFACRTPRSLPDKWACGDGCHLSAETVLDAVTCLCVVKAGLYHCRNNDDEQDDPCTAKRSLCLCAASVVMPCLCAYWPLKGCVKGLEKLYQKATFNGCTCNNKDDGCNVVIDIQPKNRDVEKKLLSEHKYY